MTELELLRELVRDACVVWEGPVEPAGKAPDGADLVRSTYARPGVRCRLVLDSSFYFEDGEKIALLNSVLSVEEET